MEVKPCEHCSHPKCLNLERYPPVEQSKKPAQTTKKLAKSPHQADKQSGAPAEFRFLLTQERKKLKFGGVREREVE